MSTDGRPGDPRDKSYTDKHRSDHRDRDIRRQDSRDSSRRGEYYDDRGRRKDEARPSERLHPPPLPPGGHRSALDSRLKERNDGRPYDRDYREHRSSEGGTRSTPPKARYEGGSSSATTPTQAARKDGKPSGSSSLMAELLKQGRKLAAGKDREDSLPPGFDEGATRSEGGRWATDEPLSDDGAAGPADAKKRKHAPIVWDPQPVAKQPKPEPQSLLDRAMMEAMELKRRQMEEDDLEEGEHEEQYLMKSSPSISGDEEEDERLAHAKARLAQAAAKASESPASKGAPARSGAAANGSSRFARDAAGDAGGDYSEEEDEHEGRAGKSGVTSRWLAEADEEEAKAGSPLPDAAAAAAAGLGPSRARTGDGAGSSGDSDGEGSDDEGPSNTLHPQRTYNMLDECRDVDEFEKVNRISEGTYGVVYKGREKSTGRIVALKRIKMEKERDGFPLTSVREINILLHLHHPNIVNVSEVVMSKRKDGQIFMVMEYMDHDLKALMDDKSNRSIGRLFSMSEVKCLMRQLLEGVAYLHEWWVLHRDLKTSNILYNNKGELKICDFGLARHYGSPLRPYTQPVVTLWYRAPELLFGSPLYTTAIDMWSCGAIMGELLTGKPMFPGNGEWDQLDKICKLMGTPSEATWPDLRKYPNWGRVALKQMPNTLAEHYKARPGGGMGLTEAGFELLSRLLEYDPSRRISATEALQHRWFQESPVPQQKNLMPTFKTSS